MLIIEKKIDEIRPYEKNPRNNKEAVKYVKNSIKEFGFKVPIVIDSQGVIVAGHTRYKASLELGLEVVPCIVADDLTPKQIKAFRLADNKTAEIATWDFDLLEGELFDLNINFDMSDFGFDFPDDEEEEAEEVKDLSDSVKSVFEVIVTCSDEQELEETYNTLVEGGYKCRVLTL